MEPIVTKQGIRRIAILTAVLAACLVAYYPFSPGGGQRSEIRKANRHDALLNAKLAQDPRFQQVTVFTYTAENVMIDVTGEVQTEEDLRILRGIVADSRPPVPLMWSISLSTTSLVDYTTITGIQAEAVSTRGNDTQTGDSR